MTMYDSPYELLPSLSRRLFRLIQRYSSANLLLVRAPDICDILAQWHRLVRRDITLLQHPAPFVRGYFTIHVSLYPGVQQLRSGLLQPHTLVRHRVLYHPYHQRHASE